MNAVIGAQACAWASDQMPASCGEMRPSGFTPLASHITKPAPPTARLPRCTRCQVLGIPSSHEYWHMGETKMRFLTVISRLSLIHISEPTRLGMISYAVFCLKKKKKTKHKN